MQTRPCSERYIDPKGPFCALVVLTVLLLACGRSETLATPNLVSSNPVDLLKQSFESFKDIESFRAQISMHIQAETLGLSAIQTADVDVAQDGTIRVSMVTDTSEGKQTVVVDHSYFYMKVADQRQGWVRMKIEAVGEQPGAGPGPGFQQLSDPMGFMTSLFPMDKVPWALYTIESLGREKVDGDQTEHLSVQVGIQRILQHLGEEQVKQILPEAASIQTIEVKKLEFWIDGQGYTRRGVLEMAFQILDLGAAGSVRMDMRFFDLNKDIRVDVPKDYQDLRLGKGYASQYVDGIGVQHPIMPGSSQTHIREGHGVNYSSTPPTSGKHWPRPAESGFYEEGLPDERITKNMERAISSSATTLSPLKKWINSAALYRGSICMMSGA